MLFRKKNKEPMPDVAFTYPQSENYRGFKRIKLSSYGYKPAEDGIQALTGKDLAGSDVKLSIYMDTPLVLWCPLMVPPSALSGSAVLINLPH